MTALAEHIAALYEMRPMTDETVDHLAVSGLTPERLAQLLLGNVNLMDERSKTREIEQAYAFLALQTILPKNIAAVPAEKIAKVREQLAGEIGKFQAAAAEFAQKNPPLGDVTDKRILQDHLETEFKKTIAPELQKLKEALSGNGIDAVLGAMDVKVDLPDGKVGLSGWVGIGALLVAATFPISPILAGLAGSATVGLLVTKWRRDQRKGRQALLAASPVSYLFRVEEALSPGELAKWISDDALKHGLAH